MNKVPEELFRPAEQVQRVSQPVTCPDCRRFVQRGCGLDCCGQPNLHYTCLKRRLETSQTCPMCNQAKGKWFSRLYITPGTEWFVEPEASVGQRIDYIILD